jgi:hypothetical protein
VFGKYEASVKYVRGEAKTIAKCTFSYEEEDDLVTSLRARPARKRSSEMGERGKLCKMGDIMSQTLWKGICAKTAECIMISFVEPFLDRGSQMQEGQNHMKLAKTIQKMPEKLKDEKSNLLSARKTENSYIQYRGNRGTLRQPSETMESR